MNWLFLILAGMLEIVWAVGLKYTHGFTRPLATSVTIVSLVLSIVFLGLAVRTLPLGTAYAIWTGIGTMGTVILGVCLLGDPLSLWRALFVVLILGGIAGLKLTS